MEKETKMSFTVVDFHQQFKVIIQGNSGSGKTSIYTRFLHNIFEPRHLPTIGVDYKNQVVECQDKIIKLQLWESGGCR